jgi:hypothetical protein
MPPAAAPTTKALTISHQPAAGTRKLERMDRVREGFRSGHARLSVYLPSLAIKNPDIPPISSPFPEALRAIITSWLGPTPASCDF